MAITIITEPASTGVAQASQGEKNKMLFRFSSNTATINSCIVEVLINGVRVSAISVMPDIGTTNEFTVLLNDIVRNHLDFKLYTTVLSTYDTTDTGFKNYNVKIYEATESVSGTIVTNYDPDNANNSNFDYTKTTDALAFNGTFNAIEQNSFNAVDYQLSGSSKKFLNNTPSIKNIELGQSEYLGALWHSGNANENFKLKILTYNSVDALLNTDFIDITDWNNGYAGQNFVFYYITLPVGTANLIAASVSLTNVSYYTIRMINDTGDVSELKRFNIVDSCGSDVRVHWCNNLGKQDSYTFKGNKIETLNHKAKNYLKALPITYATSNRGSKVMQNISNSSFEIFTDSINKNDYEFLASMLINKNAFIEDSGSYYPIIIEDGSKLIRNELNVPIQFKLVYRFANDTKGLRG